MKTKLKTFTPTELNEMFRRAGEAALAETRDVEMEQMVEVLKANAGVVKSVLRAVGIAGYKKHLKTQGFDCSIDRLRTGLVNAALWQPTRHKAKPSAQ